MRLEINGKIINPSIREVLDQINQETGKDLFRDVKGSDKDRNLMVSCPIHKGGHENHASCQIFQDESDEKVEYGFVHCFTCGYKAPLCKMVADCFDQSEEFGKEWLVERYGNILIHQKLYLPEIVLNPVSKTKVLPESILENFDYYHPYMFQRKLIKPVIDRYRIGYDKERDAITFPVWDEKDQLVMITARSVSSKKFYIDADVEKPVYLLNFLKRDHITTAYVCESQINTLTLLSWGYPAIGLIGTGSRSQYEILRRSGIRNYILCFDGDEAGDKGIQRFISNMPKDIMISVKRIPRGRDINDLDKETFDSLELIW